MPRTRPPHLHYEQTRHGRHVWYVRQAHGPRTRLKAAYGSEEFWAEYRAALQGTPRPTKAARANTLAWALQRYRQNSAWTKLSNATRRQRENIFRAAIVSAGSVALTAITADTLRAGRERRAA